MIKRTFHIATLLFLLIHMSCVEDVRVDVEAADERMVISSLYLPDSLIIVTVTRSFSALSAKSLTGLENDLIETLLVEEALVTITSNDRTDTLSRLAPGVFAGALTQPETLQPFALYVYDSLTGASVTSITELKRQVRFDSVSIHMEVNSGDTSKYVYYEFTDPANQENWYVVQGFELPRLPSFDNVQFDEANGEIIVEPDTSNQVFFELSTTLLFQDLVSDLTLEDQTVSEQIYIPKETSDTMVFVLINVDPGYYDFLQARRRSGGILASLTREPVNHPSNVMGGYGYFTMHTPHFGLAVRREE